jgi:SpoVK/Ycf46/Vps4 family AAA+-type ATPase
MARRGGYGPAGKRPAAGGVKNRPPWANDLDNGALADKEVNMRAGSATNAPQLVLQCKEDGEAPGVIQFLPGKQNKLGRDPRRCDHVFTSNAVSGFHCIIEKKGSKWYVEDQGSTNGVYVNDNKIKSAHELVEGTIVCFGAPEYRYLFKDAAKGFEKLPGGAAGGRKPLAGGAAGRRLSADDKPAAKGKAAAPRGPAGRRGSVDAPGAVPKAMGAGAAAIDPSATINPNGFGIYVGDRVEVQSGSKRTGEAMYVGPAEFHGGRTVVGVRLDEKRPGSDCDGKHKGERFFRCMVGYGLYVPLEDVKLIQPDEAPEKDENFDLEKELENIVGLTEVKDMLRGMERSVEVQKRRAAFGVKAERAMHMVFAGNPGTGKTMVARMIGKMMLNMDILERGHLVEVTRKDMVGPYSGETAKNTSAVVERARGGVLFIDEAYTLKHEGSSDSHGQECVDTLLKEMENHKDVVVILAGYSKEMAGLLNVNPGIQSRFPNHFTFSDYTNEEMAQIVLKEVEVKGFVLEPSLDQARITEIISNNVKKSEASKGNGRLCRTLVEQAVERQTDRVFKSETMSKESLTTLRESDFLPDEVEYGEMGDDGELSPVETAIAKLQSIVGLADVKKHIQALRAQLQLNKERKEAGVGCGSDMSLHMVFTGNPGTGKTSVARIVAELLSAMGVLSRGHLVEVDRSGLVAGYSGQTALKTKAVVESALGGVLFVDEAYALVQESRDSFGKEALDTLIKMVEDHRDNLVVILAGYSGEMKQMIAQNPGVRSRFPTVIDFADYTSDELMSIAGTMLEKDGFRLSSGASEVLRQMVDTTTARAGKDNGNGREVRNMLEAARRKQALRLLEVKGKKTEEQLCSLEAEDFTLEDV